MNMDARLSVLPKESVDLVVTDPPYFDNIQYGELSDFYYQWLKYFLQKSLGATVPANCMVLNGSLTSATETANLADEFTEGLSQVFRDCHRVLKPNGLLMFSFHYRNQVGWSAVSQALTSAKFFVANVIPVRSEGHSGFHSSEVQPSLGRHYGLS